MNDFVQHVSVMLRQVGDLCADLEEGWVVDGTVGLGGHAEEILRRTPEAVRVLGMDRDPSALAVARARLEAFGTRFVAVHRGYEDLPEVLEERGIGPVPRLILDLGLSNAQLASDRGFSVRPGQPLDLRFDPGEGRPARDRIREVPEPVLAAALRDHGDVPAAARLARRLKEEARRGRMETTDDLIGVCREVLGPRVRTMPSALLPLQALRILVNDEMGRLDRLLDRLPQVIRPGGRVGVLAFHSGEDRRVKQAFRRLAASGAFRLPHRKPVSPDPEEVRRNRQARSAHWRVLERAGGEP
ncbi:MAG TPA: 16S rRNA (cytosine(1402)-N(4))-methyltransferase RsmH [Myxococcota bacterium]|nr:16S rRNA (cytosine(1402)-N(4))-methyltransferase RsmH [Myxococcota bacterium]HQK49617.1 16S rRNA (cytosine(1402)-N(4))-methyltransferase RsmH [Myxococcota bacterium]